MLNAEMKHKDLKPRTKVFALRVIHMYSNLPRMAVSIQHLDFSLSRPLMFRAVIRLLAALALLFSLTVRAADWPQFRGPLGNGVAQEYKAPLHWGPEKNVRWKATLPGPGNSSPIVSHGRVFITCAEDAGKKRNLYCFDRRTGKELWVRTVEFPIVEPTHQSNPYCASTPVADGARVVVWHGSPGVFCYDFDGKELWKKDLGEVRNEWGYGSSPILHRGKVILNFGPGDRAFLAALDLKTGKLLWKYDEPGGSSSIDKRNIGFSENSRPSCDVVHGDQMRPARHRWHGLQADGI